MVRIIWMNELRNEFLAAHLLSIKSGIFAELLSNLNRKVPFSTLFLIGYPSPTIKGKLSLASVL